MARPSWLTYRAMFGPNTQAEGRCGDHYDRDALQQSARQGHVRSRRKPTLVGLKENQRINPTQSKFAPGRGCHTAG